MEGKNFQTGTENILKKKKFGCDQKVPKKISKPSHVAINYFFSINKNY